MPYACPACNAREINGVIVSQNKHCEFCQNRGTIGRDMLVKYLTLYYGQDIEPIKRVTEFFFGTISTTGVE